MNKNSKTNKNSFFYGIRGIHFIWHGAYSDPEIIWHNHSFNYYDLEDTLWCIYREECEEIGANADSDAFPAWVKDHAATARDVLQNILDARKETRQLRSCAA